MKNLLLVAVIILNTLLVACTNDNKEASAVNHAAVYTETMTHIIASDSGYAEAMTDVQVVQNNMKVFNELKSTLQASGCYNEQIEKAYFNDDSIKLGYKPADFNAMCLIAK